MTAPARRAARNEREEREPVMRRPTIAMLLATAMLATLTVTAFALAGPVRPAPRPGDLPRIVSVADPAASSSDPTATPAPGTSPSPDATRTKPAKATAPAKNGSSASTKTGGKTSAHSGDNDADDTAGHDSSDDDHDSDDHEVVRPHLHESDGNEHRSEHD